MFEHSLLVLLPLRGWVGTSLYAPLVGSAFAELASFYDDVLGRLQAYDERQGADLVNTIEAFFECHGNHVRTAQRLHLHRNTLLYRLDRARQVLEADFDDPETRLALQVALKIGRVIGRRPLDAASAANA